MSKIASKHKINLKILLENDWFLEWIKDADIESPKIPSFVPGDNDYNDGMWKYYSGMREGYKQCLSHLGVSLNE